LWQRWLCDIGTWVVDEGGTGWSGGSVIKSANGSNLVLRFGVNTAPTITATNASPNPVSGTNTVLSVTATDDGGEPALTYTWSTNGASPAAVIFSTNGNNAAQTSTATFTEPGAYGFRVVVSDGELTATGQVDVTVNQTLTSIAVSPPGATVLINGTRQYGATGYDQFGDVLPLATTNWSVTGDGSIDGAGLFTAGTTPGVYTVTADDGSVTGATPVTVSAATWWTISASNGPNGAVSPNGNVQVEESSNQTFLVTADAGYRINDVKADGVSQGATNSYTFENVTTSHTFYADFTNSAPTVVNAATATVASTTALLEVLGGDDQGEANLTYTWSVTGTPPGTVTFSANSNNAAKSATATFTNSGTYGFQAVIRDQPGLTATSSVSATVNQVATTITVAPAVAYLSPGESLQFTAAGRDQFGHSMALASTNWSVPGPGTIDSASGLYTAAGVEGGPYTVTASSGAATGTATVSVSLPLHWDGTTNNWDTQHWRDSGGGLHTPVAGLRHVIASGLANSVAGAFAGEALTLATNGVLDAASGGIVAGNTGIPGQGSLVFSGGELRDSAASGIAIFRVTNGPNTYVVASTTNRANVQNAAATLRHDAILAGGGTLQKAGAGTYQLSFAANPAFSGTVDVVEGVLAYGSENAFAAATVIVGSNGTLKLPGANVSNAFAVLRLEGGIVSNTASTTINGPVEIPVRSFFTGTGANTLNGSVSGGGNLVLKNTSTSGTSLDPSFSGSGWYGAAEFNGCPRLLLYGVNATLGGLVAGDPAVYVTTATGAGTPFPLTLQPPAGTTNAFAGVIKDASGTLKVGLTVTNAGVQKLSGTNTYTGATAVNGGTLVVNGALSNSTATVTVNAGGTLAGKGRIDRPVTVNDGGTLSPGDDGADTLTVSNLVLSANSTNRFDLATPATSDKVAVTAALTLAGTLDIRALPGLSAGTFTLYTCASHSGSAAVIMPPKWQGLLDTTSSPTEVRLIVTYIFDGTVILLR
jgi:autotransporter-associated beta strand protein